MLLVKSHAGLTCDPTVCLWMRNLGVHAGVCLHMDKIVTSALFVVLEAGGCLGTGGVIATGCAVGVRSNELEGHVAS